MASYVSWKISTGRISDQAAAVTRLMAGVNSVRQATIAYEISGPSAAAWTTDESGLGAVGNSFLTRQTS